MMEAKSLKRFLQPETAGDPPGTNGSDNKPVLLNLRKVLAELGHRLVQEHGFQPANLHGCSALVNHTLEPLVRFLVWLEHTPEASFVLQQMGVWQLDPLRTELGRLNLEEHQGRTLHERANRELRGSRRPGH
jgi:hypothetical protein